MNARRRHLCLAVVSIGGSSDGGGSASSVSCISILKVAAHFQVSRMEMLIAVLETLLTNH